MFYFIIVGLLLLSFASRRLTSNNLKKKSKEANCWIKSMIDNKSSFGEKSVSDIIIPATHESGLKYLYGNIEEGKAFSTLSAFRKKVNDKEKKQFENLFSLLGLNNENLSEEEEINENKKEIKLNDEAKKLIEEMTNELNVEEVSTKVENPFVKYMGIHIFTQYYKIKEQLDLGVRFLDFSFSLNKKSELVLVKRLFGLKIIDITFENIMSQVIEFLKSSCSNDFVIIRLAVEQKDSEILQQIINQNKEYKKYMIFRSSIPKVNEIIGKIWIIPAGFNTQGIEIKTYGTEKNILIWNSIVASENKIISYRKKEKLKELYNFRHKIYEPKYQKKLKYFGWQVTYLKTWWGKYNHLYSSNTKGTTKGEFLFEEEFLNNQERKNKINFGCIIGMDWATSKMIQTVFNLNSNLN